MARDPTLKVKIRDLDPLHSPKVSGNRPELRKLSDRELLKAINNPRNGDRLKISSKTGKLVDGNGRAYELLRRAISPQSQITLDTEVDCEPYTPDDSLDWDRLP